MRQAQEGVARRRGQIGQRLSQLRPHVRVLHQLEPVVAGGEIGADAIAVAHDAIGDDRAGDRP